MNTGIPTNILNKVVSDLEALQAVSKNPESIEFALMLLGKIRPEEPRSTEKGGRQYSLVEEVMAEYGAVRGEAVQLAKIIEVMIDVIRELNKPLHEDTIDVDWKSFFDGLRSVGGVELANKYAFTHQIEQLYKETIGDKE